ncbi:MAG: XdhC family protein [Anaerolineae bacterium]|nr:XdhC family protein [Anaerolineae bacterium]MCO5192857.1 XdhC family protein [Anaerolineae bacterium]
MPIDTLSLLKELAQAQESGKHVALATVVKARGSTPRNAGAKMLVYADGRTSGTIGGGEMESRVVAEALAALADGKPRLVPYTLVDPAQGDPGVCGGEMEIYVEPYLPPETVFVIGCGHVGQAVAELAHWLGYRVVVTDDREELVSAETITADLHLPGTIEDALAQFTVTSNTHIVVVTRNVLIDRRILPHLVKTPAQFIGVMGSRRRWTHTRSLLLEDGLTETELERFHSPLGLELNAETPKEIAVSIMAEIIMLRRAGTGKRMSNKLKTVSK